MPRPRKGSAASDETDGTARDQELGSMYDYLAKIILLGPSGSGKSCLLHRFTTSTWRPLTSQTIGVEFASKIIRIGPPSRPVRIKLQLWDTAGTERFRSVSRSYYRGAAGAILVYDLTNRTSFEQLGGFLNDARALASPNLTVVMAGNKKDLADPLVDLVPPMTPSSLGSVPENVWSELGTSLSSTPGGGYGYGVGLGTQQRATVAPEGREVTPAESSRWAGRQGIPVTLEVSAFSGENVEEVFERLARMILTKIEVGEIDPDDAMSGIQYGDAGWGVSGDGGSVRSGASGVGDGTVRRRRGRRGPMGGMREWEEVFTLSGRTRRKGGCC